MRKRWLTHPIKQSKILEKLPHPQTDIRAHLPHALCGVRHNRDKIRPGLGVIISRQADGAPVLRCTAEQFLPESLIISPQADRQQGVIVG